jgi:hypothetical protein
MEESPETLNSSPGLVRPCCLWKPKMHFHKHKNTLHHTVKLQINSAHSLIWYTLDIGAQKSRGQVARATKLIR